VVDTSRTPIGSRRAHEFGNGGAAWRVGEAVGDLVRACQAAAGHDPPLVGGLIAVEVVDGGQSGRGPVVDTRSFRAVAAGMALPGVVGCLGDREVDAAQGVDILGFRHGQDVADAGFLQHAAEAPFS